MTAKVTIFKLKLTTYYESLFRCIASDLKTLSPYLEATSQLNPEFNKDQIRYLIAMIDDLQPPATKPDLYDYLIMIHNASTLIEQINSSITNFDRIEIQILTVKMYSIQKITAYILSHMATIA